MEIVLTDYRGCLDLAFKQIDEAYRAGHDVCIWHNGVGGLLLATCYHSLGGCWSDCRFPYANYHHTVHEALGRWIDDTLIPPLPYWSVLQ